MTALAVFPALMAMVKIRERHLAAAVAHLRLVFAELHAVTIRETVSFHALLLARTSEPYPA